jgi:hypothetical protein
MKTVLGLLFCLSGTYALACQPPPINYFELGNLNAIVNSPEVRTKMAGIPIKGIRQAKDQPQKYFVRAKECSLMVEVKAEQTNPDAPCGGPYTFTAVVAETEFNLSIGFLIFRD